MSRTVCAAVCDTNVPPLVTAPKFSAAFSSSTVANIVRTNTSASPFVSPVTRLVANESNTTMVPSALSAQLLLPALPRSPFDATLTRVLFRVTRSIVSTS